MKAKTFLLGLTFFFIGIAVTVGIQSNNRHQHFTHQAGVRKMTVIEVGAPLTVTELKQLGLI
jgi:hypothetical protein